MYVKVSHYLNLRIIAHKKKKKKITDQLQACQYLSVHKWGNKKVPHWLEY